jgi:signal transduction histidine kinase/CheY-like chemotaxis protein
MHDDMCAEGLNTARFSGNRNHRNRWFRTQLWAVLPVLLCLEIVLIGIFSFPSPTAALERKNVLILNSYHQGFKWTDDITRGIITAMDPVRPETRIYIEYMNTKWANDARYFKELSRLLAIKYAKTRFDLIVCSDTDALEFLLDHRDQIFGRIPVVFCGVNYFKDEDLQGKRFFTGVSETADLKESIDLALRLHPGTKEIFVINDNGTPGKKVRDQLEQLIPLYRGNVRFTFAKSADLDKIVADVAELPADTLIFYTFFYGDPALRFYENSESISRISEHARVPIYGTWDFNLDYGMVGGKLTSGYDQGFAAGSMGMRILKGERIETIPVVYRNPARYMFDYRQLKRFGIDRRLLPKESTIINEPETFRKVSKNIIWATLLGVGGLGFLVFILLTNIRQRRKVEESLRKARTELERKVEERTRDLFSLNEQLSNLNWQLSDDIDKRQQAEQELRKSQTILNRIFEANPDHLVVIDSDLRIIHSNWLGGYEYVPPEIRHLNPYCYQAYNPGQEKPCESCAALEVFKTGKPVFTEMYNARIGYLEIRAVPIFDDSGKVLMVAEHIRDITERRKMEDELLKAQKLESLGVLAGGIAHDFNNLLTAILGNISLAKMFADPETKAFERLGDAEKACERATALTQQLLTFSKGGAPVKKTASIVQIITDSAGFMLRGSNVRCEFNLQKELWAVDVDAGQMSQVINNLIINADQAMPDGGIIAVSAENVTIDGSEALSLKAGRYICISIRDEGVGIPQEYLAKIFDPYFTTKQRGSGLGLATVYSIIKSHQGHLEVESAEGVGTVFRLYLPASEKEIEQKENAGGEETSLHSSGRILVMDDEEIIRDIARETLHHLGYEVDVCRDGVSALALYREALKSGKPYAAVIMDLTIQGGMGGKETMKALLELDPQVKGIVSSGYNNDPILAHFREYGFCGMVSKPYTVKELHDTLHQLL